MQYVPRDAHEELKTEAQQLKRRRARDEADLDETLTKLEASERGRQRSAAKSAKLDETNVELKQKLTEALKQIDELVAQVDATEREARSAQLPASFGVRCAAMMRKSSALAPSCRSSWISPSVV